MAETVSFKVPASPQKSIQTIDTFLGVDFTNSPANVDITKSPNAPNMIRDVPGKVRKSLGWEVVKTYALTEEPEEEGEEPIVTPLKINGYHAMRGDNEYIIHAGTNFYHGDDLIYSDANDERSRSWQFDDKLYIIDGKQLLVYYKTTETPEGEDEPVTTYHVEPVSNSAYIPTLTISKDPTGGGTSYEDLNLLQPGFIEQFLGTSSGKEYALSFGELDDTPVTAQKMAVDGNWVDLVEGTDFTVNRTTGVVTFTVAPGVSPITGEDNVKITAYRTVEDYSDRINKCTIGTLYGVNGGNDRLFLSGNPNYLNYDWHSQQYDPTYFPDTSYARLGSDSSAIVGYSTVSSYLATHKDDMERNQNIIMRSGSTTDGQTIFKVVNSLQGAGAIAKDSFGYLATEPLFLTSQGVYAVTAQDITGEKYAQNRSFYLNGKLLEEADLKNAFAIVYKDMYWLCVNNVCYILDGLQPIMTDKSMPYATRQYVGFYRTNVPANVMWVKDNELWFGTADGRVCRFFTDKYAQNSYNDDGEPIVAVWETPDIDGKLFYKNKTLKYLAVRIESAVATSLKIYAMERGLWNFIKEDNTFGRYFMFSQLIFSKLTFSNDATQKISSTKMRIKKVDKFRIRLVNDVVNEPFGLYDIAMEYRENGNFKG